jgi:branched-chain amino acid transport system substrate-binding protein
MVTRVYERLIVDEKVDLVFAPFGSTLTAAAATVTERLGKYMMVWSAASDDLYKQGFKNMVSGTQMPVSAMLRANMELAAKQGVKKVALLYSDEPFPAGLAEGGKEQAAKNGMEVVLFEKYPKGQKDFSTILQKARAAGAEALVPTSYEGDLISMTRQMKQLDINFPYVFMVYASTPQFQAIGADSNYIYSHTNYHPAINWKVNAGLTREQFAAAYDQRFPKAEFPPDFQTALAYGAGALTEEIVKQAGSTDAAALKKASLDLSGKLTVMAGPYAIDETGKQLLMPFPVVQLLPGKGMVPVWPADVATQKPVYPAPDWNKR